MEPAETAGKTVLVTGATSGIGLATAKALIKAGYTVYGTSRNPATEPDDPAFLKMRLLPLDLTDEGSIDRLLAALPPIDILINNAGASQCPPWRKRPPEVRGLFDLCCSGRSGHAGCAAGHAVQGGRA